MINNKIMFSQNKVVLSLVMLMILSSILAGYAGYYLGRNRQTVKSVLNNDPRFEGLEDAPNNQIFYKQSAEIRGQMVKVEAGKVTLKNSNGIEASFQIADPVFVTRYGAKGAKNAKYEPAAGLELNKNVIVVLESLPIQVSENMQFKVSGVEFLP